LGKKKRPRVLCGGNSYQFRITRPKTASGGTKNRGGGKREGYIEMTQGARERKWDYFH